MEVELILADVIIDAMTLRSGEMEYHPTPLRGSAFELELIHHPDKAWVSRLLIGINNGVSTGYKGPHCHFQARNLASALAHPEDVDAELKKEVDSGRVLDPFPSCPLHNFRTSGLGVVLKKNGKCPGSLELMWPPKGCGDKCWQGEPLRSL